MASLDFIYFSHKVCVNVHHLEWCTKYRYRLLRKPENKKLCEDAIRTVAERHSIKIRELNVRPEHVHISAELPPSMSQSKALQLLKGGSAYLIFKAQPKFRLRCAKGNFWSPGAYAGSVGNNTVEIVDDYVKNQDEVHQATLEIFTAGSLAL